MPPGTAERKKDNKSQQGHEGCYVGGSVLKCYTQTKKKKKKSGLKQQSFHHGSQFGGSEVQAGLGWVTALFPGAGAERVLFSWRTGRSGGSKMASLTHAQFLGRAREGWAPQGPLT